ncbi:hypothetical protein [Mesorhizobium sp. WSM3860]|uniref:hypothetical protein n=1 Tax=Mesorhizobium sp. WSM3860 TaxID=2029403 RepID=UPI000BAF6F93|nr:hypothetical protein [Mesorhizobium sp. WSM3860]PBC00891.1 hypothetical protein CK220_28620 [Mesorhizobium sp. WSM3860]
MAGPELSDNGEILIVRLPLAIRKRGGRKLVVSPGSQEQWQAARPRVDNTLLRAVVQAFDWKHQLDAGRFATVSELAEAIGLDRSFVGHMLRLTLLAPDLVEAILDGRQSKTMQLQPLVRGFPVVWERQRRNTC